MQFLFTDTHSFPSVTSIRAEFVSISEQARVIFLGPIFVFFIFEDIHSDSTTLMR